MPFIKEPITELIFSSNFDRTYDGLLVKLMELSLEIKIQDKKRGEIIICCLNKVFNMLFWKCYIDKLLFKVEQIEINKTRVNIVGLPNLFRLKAPQENVIDINKIISRIKHGMQLEKA